MAFGRWGFGVAAAVAPVVIRSAAEMAEALGYDSFWVNDTPDGNGLVALAEAAAVTTSIKLGVGVIPLSRKTPERVVAEIAALNQAAGHEGHVGEEILTQDDWERVHGLGLPTDRLLVGVGSGAGPGALQRTRHGVRALKSALDADVVVAALGPKMCQLAGAEADGVLFNWLTPDFARISAELVRTGAKDAGRSAPALYTYVRVALGTDGIARLTREGDRYRSVPAYAAHFERMGVEPTETAIAARAEDEIRPALEPWRGALDEVIIRAITPNDTIDETLALVNAAAPLA